MYQYSLCIFHSITKYPKLLTCVLKNIQWPLNWIFAFFQAITQYWWQIIIQRNKTGKKYKQKCRWIDKDYRSSICMGWYSMETIAIRPGHGVWGHDLISEVISWGGWRHASIIKEVINEIHDTMSTYMSVNSLVPDWYASNFETVIYNCIICC